jgi:cytochrome b pre-mRNA-processing protein 3
LELNIREIGYGDQSVNKKMKDYINNFHAIISNIHFWHELDYVEKEKKISPFLSNFENIGYLVDYFEKFRNNLAKKTLKSFLKSVSKH